MKNINICKLIILFLFVLAFSQNSFSQLSGIYTIGTGGNYDAISDAVNALNSSGVSSNVVFNIKPGSYHESVTINQINGANANRTVTFKSLTNHAEDVEWFPASSSSAFTLKINEADFLKIRDISFPDDSTSNEKNRIHFQGQCSGIEILNNEFLGGRSQDNGLFSYGALMENLLIEGNRFEIKNGINFKEMNLISTDTKIYDNIVNCVYGIVIYNHDNLRIEKNDFNCISVSGGNPSPSCIRVSGCNGNLKILRNKLVATSIKEAEDGIVVGYYSGENALIANNFISLNTGTGMWFDACHNVNIFFNTVVTASVNSGDITFVECYGEYTSKNNLLINLANQATQSLTYYIWNSDIPNSDYNLFLYYNPLMAFVTPDYITNLADLRATAGCDMHSIEWHVNFVSATDFHLAGSSIGDQNLMGIPLSEIATDIDGQPRSATSPYMGADEADVPLHVINSSLNFAEQYFLAQNYPNPFNPTTKIKFDLSLNSIHQMSNVKLSVYDILGKKVSDLVSQDLAPGSYEVQFDAADYPSGIYFYSLSVNDNQVDRKKMVLLR